MSTSRINQIIFGFLILVIAIPASVVFADPIVPISGYINQINTANLVDVATDLVTLYGPRNVDNFSPYLDDSCTPNNSIVYPKSTIEMSADYVKGLFEAMGYSPESITMEELPGGGERNVFVTKVGSTYPNTFIEFSGHLDSVANSPGGADNASGSAAVIELARVLKDYPNRYSMRFILWAAEEYSVPRGSAYNGSNYHVQQSLARGEQIKAGLIMDHIGWPNPSDPTGYMNEISYNDVESERIANIFGQVRTDYGIEIGFGIDQAIQNSDEHSYWEYGQIAVSSGGGWLFYRPNYHDCGDTVDNIDFTNVLRVAQQNLAVGLILDGETDGATPTPTITSPISTATPGPSPTVTNTPLPPTATNTPLPPSGFPTTGILDAFNRANGSIGSNWSGDTAGYTIVNNQLDTGLSQDIYWNGTSFGANQEAFVTLTNIDINAGEIDLILKSQSNSLVSPGQIDVLYSPAGGYVQIWTYINNSNGWQQHGSSIPVTFVNGDQFGARAKVNGEVEVYRNGALVGVRDVTNWPYYTSGGYIGIFAIGASNAIFDDFGGGIVSSSPTSTPTSLPTATNTPLPPTATNTPLPTATSTSLPPTNTPLPPTATNTPLPPTNTPLPPTATNTPLPPTATNTPLPTATSTSLPPTNTPLPPTATNTPLPPTATSTPLPPTATNTPLPPSGFPTTGILDAFNRANGSIGSNWSGDTSGYTIVNNQLDTGLSQDIYWNGTSFGANQEAFVTLTNIDINAEEINLILKSQSNNSVISGQINVVYSPTGNYVQVWTYINKPNGWKKHGQIISVTFENGDQFGARAKVNGEIEVYRNGVLIGVRDISNWTYYANSGYIGLFTINASNTVFDNFGGGSFGTSPTPTPTPVPCTDPTSCDPVSAIPVYWRCDTPECSGGDWIGNVISWPSWSAYENNGRTGNNSRTVYSLDGEVLYPYMGSWADGCQVTAVSGIVLIIEWERGTDVWRETYLEPGQNHTISLASPENGALIEGLNDLWNDFSVSINNCTPQIISPDP